jgi:hypothetical protein
LGKEPIQLRLHLTELIGLEEEVYSQLLDMRLHGMVHCGSLLDNQLVQVQVGTQSQLQPMELLGLEEELTHFQLVEMELRGTDPYG